MTMRTAFECVLAGAMLALGLQLERQHEVGERLAAAIVACANGQGFSISDRVVMCLVVDIHGK